MKKSLMFSCLVILVGTMGASVVSVSCGGEATEGRLESESHFLTACTNSCPDGLSCVSGVCTESCVIGEPDRCGELAEGALCTNLSIEPGAVAVCDVPCEVQADCSKISEFHDCSNDYCRAPSVDSDDDSSGTDSGMAGGASMGEGDVDNYVYAQPVDFPHGRESFGCSIPDGLFDEERRMMNCTLVRAELPQVGTGQPDCLAPGRAPVSLQLGETVRAFMAGDACGEAEGDCLDWALCEFTQISSTEIEDCRTNVLSNSLIEPTGFCGIDLEVEAPIIQSQAMEEAIIEACDGETRAIRLTGGHVVEGSIISEIWMACTVEPSN